ncbi:MAG TPA: hypothetical protein PK849_11640 [Synergistales bacterium]|nr:hypothetical protein [Synergistales bacterium]
MNLSAVLGELLASEDEAVNGVETAKRKASKILREAREHFAADQEARLAGVRAQSKTIVESALHSAELEAAQIAEMGANGRRKMEEHFTESAPEIVRSLVMGTAARYGRLGG